MTDKIKHLDYIQQTIARMATVSFQVKAWNIGLVTAILAFAAKDRDPSFLWAALLPAVMLWFLDSFFLRQGTFIPQAVRRGARRRSVNQRLFDGHRRF